MRRKEKIVMKSLKLLVGKMVGMQVRGKWGYQDDITLLCTQQCPGELIFVEGLEQVHEEIGKNDVSPKKPP